ncbi:MAG: class II glutamine amidotransferase [Candidatus Eremiobacteraeota bacterium]|nr:class II glutamine amidotransferase [Candidatus Eremiobacteraeota bacterium]
MCRILAYLGPELPLENLLLKPTNSLVNQSRAPEHHPLMQLAGWGFAAWSENFLRPDVPLRYRRAVPAFFDDNTGTLIPALQGHTVLAHIRASTYQSEAVIADENCHPFCYEGTPWSMVHNGSLPNWRILQRELLSHCKDEYLGQMCGTTDTEFVYALFLSLLEEDDGDGFQDALERMLKLIIKSMRKLKMVSHSKLKLAFACQNRVVAVNYGSGFHGETNIEGDLKELRKAKVGSKEFLLSTILEPLYVLKGRDFHKYEDYQIDACHEHQTTAAVLASEPLTEETEDWLELEFGKMILMERDDDGLRTEVRALEL